MAMRVYKKQQQPSPLASIYTPVKLHLKKSSAQLKKKRPFFKGPFVIAENKLRLITD